MIWKWYRKRWTELPTPTRSWVRETYRPFKGWTR